MESAELVRIQKARFGGPPLLYLTRMMALTGEMPRIAPTRS